jgi:uncharacterized protein YqeY
MSLVEQLQKDLVQSMKSKDTVRTSVLRMIKSALKNREIEKGEGLAESEVVRVLRAQLKQRNEAIEQFEAGGRAELAAKERQEKAVIESYLPEPITGQEMDDVVSMVIQEVGASGPQDMGAVMKEAMVRLQATGKTVDGKAVNRLVKSKLQALVQKDSD